MSDFYGLNKLVDENGGVENFRCFAMLDRIIGSLGGFAVCGSKRNWVECRISEDRYNLAEGYKVTLKPVDPNSGYAREDYYQSDFVSMIKSGHIVVKTSEDMKILHDTFAEPLYGDAYIVHDGDYIGTKGEN